MGFGKGSGADGQRAVFFSFQEMDRIANTNWLTGNISTRNTFEPDCVPAKI